MSQADGGPQQPAVKRGPNRLLITAIVEGVIVAALVATLIIVSIRRSGDTANASSAGGGGGAGAGTAMCAAIPVANQVLPSSHPSSRKPTEATRRAMPSISPTR